MTTFISKVTTIRPGIIRILGCNPGPMTLQGTNTYLIGTGTKRVLLDVGEARNAEYITSLESVLQQQNTSINQIIISHWHHDHIGGLKDVLKCLPEPVSVYKIPRLDKDDDPMLDLTTYIPLKHLDVIKTQGATLRWKNDVRCISSNTLGNMYGPCGGAVPLSLAHESHRSSPVLPMVRSGHSSVEVATVCRGAVSVHKTKVYHTPGHTTDHAVLELVEENAVFSGDCVLGEGTTVFEDLHSYMNSLKMLVKICPNIIYPGHGPIIEDPVSRLQHYIKHREQREKQILEVMNLKTKKFLTALEVVKAVYKDTPDHLHRAAAENVVSHMNKLLKDGKIVSQGDGWCLVDKIDKL